MLNSILAIMIGASCGALCRWFLSMKLNHLLPNLPLGTLVANLLGGYLIGFLMAFFAHHASNPEWRLLLITGFLGALTTFSTFSAEMVTLLQQQQYTSFMVGIVSHVAGCLLMTYLGLMTFRLFH
ncbi:fluoride efflux transporter CrcB [Pelistega europaea]|uniref:Fluoride-specific ion channel FluC n=1 Tax=Pelistega europaea TaxID=106147 RepID=A0A7Y4P390_9BURK|nr:fluoride efflux transporter CrcB [Pelistega europaea]NOL48777.1 fluoride efflux transporter CrcB [Pelistega europaea]